MRENSSQVMSSITATGAIHRLDRKRSKGPLIAINCGAITAGVAESELFGHRRGAFTGAERDRPGLIRAANAGILAVEMLAMSRPELRAKLQAHREEMAADVKKQTLA